MMRRWLSLVLMTWATIAPLLAYAPAAEAKGEKFTFQDAQTIVVTGSDAIPNNTKFGQTDLGTTYSAQASMSVITGTGVVPCMGQWTISGVKKGTGDNYTGTISTQNACGKTALNTSVTIAGGGKGPTAQQLKKTPTDVGGGDFGGGDSTADPTCVADGGLTWLLCGIINVLVGVVDWIRENIIVPFLEERPLNKNDENIQPIYTIWSSFRNVASVLFILVFFLIIFGTAIGWDNYTIKKVLPRLIAGAILVPFSWYICVAAIDLGNVLGQGILALTSTVVPKGDTIQFSTPLSEIFFTGAAGGGILLGIHGAIAAVTGVSFGVIITMALGFLAVFITLVLRKILIMMLVVLSPFALLAWILPNTERWFKQWWSEGFKLIMMYPIIILFFEMGRLFASVAPGVLGTPTTTENQSTTQSQANATESVAGQLDSAAVPILQLMGLTLPLFGVPMAFGMAGKGLALAGGLTRKLAGGADSRWGKNSGWAQDRAQRRTDKALKAEATHLDNNKKIRAALARSRSGYGGGFGGLGKGNMYTQLRRKEALDKAADTEKKYKGMKLAEQATKEDPRNKKETFQQKVEAGAFQEANELMKGKGMRAGVRQFARDTGTAGLHANFDDAKGGTHESLSEAHGTSLGLQNARIANPVTTQQMVTNAMSKAGTQHTRKLTGIQTGAAVAGQITRDYMNTHGGTPMQAEVDRLRHVARAEMLPAMKAAADDHSTTMALSNAMEHVDSGLQGGGLVNKVLASSYLEQQQKGADQVKAITQRLKYAQTEGSLSTGEALKIAEARADERVINEEEDRRAILKGEGEKGTEYGNIIESARRASEQRHSEGIAARENLINAERTAEGIMNGGAPTTMSQRVEAARASGEKAAAAAAGARFGILEARQQGVKYKVSDGVTNAANQSGLAYAQASKEDAAAVQTYDEELKRLSELEKKATGTPLTTQQAQQRMLQQAANAGAETTTRKEAARFGSNEALSEAYTQTGRTPLSSRIGAYQQSELNRAAQEEATVKMFEDESMRRNYQDAVTASTESQRDKFLETRASEEAISYKTKSGVALKDAPLDTDGIKELSSIITASSNPKAPTYNPAVAIAAARRLSVSQGGENELAKLRVSNLFGGGDTDTVKDEYKDMWSKMVVNAKSPDLKKAPLVAWDDLSPKEVAGMTRAQVVRAMEYYNSRPKNIETELQTKLQAAENDFNSSSKTAVDVAARDKAINDAQEAAQKARVKVAKSRDQFNASLSQALGNRNLQNEFNPDTLEAIREAAAGNLKDVAADTINPLTSEAISNRIAELDLGAPQVPPTINDAIIKATGGDLDYATEVYNRIVADQYTPAGPPGSPTSAEQRLKNITDKVLGGQRLTEADLGGPKTTSDTMPQALQKFIKQSKPYKNDLNKIAQIHKRYNTDPDYKRAVDQAYFEGRTPPLPPTS